MPDASLDSVETSLQPTIAMPAEMPVGKVSRLRGARFIVAIAAVAVFLTLAAVLAWWLSRPVAGEIAASVETSIDPTALFQEQVEGLVSGELKMLHVTQYAVTPELLARLPIDRLQTLTTVLIDEGVVEDAEMAIVAKLSSLEHLRLRLSPITDAGLQPLLGCKDLMVLNLPHSKLTSAGVASLAALPRLRQLRLGSTNLTNDSCQSIASVKSLRSLHLIGVAIGDEGLKILAELPHLESLYLDDSAVTEIGWDWLFRQHPQLHVHVNQKHHDRDPKKHNHHDALSN